MCVLSLSNNSVWKTFHTKRNLARYYHKCAHVFMYSTRYSCQILMKLEFSWQILDSPNIKFHDNSAVGVALLHADGQMVTDTDRQTNMTNSRFAQFCELA
jgi:hypothetical protein